MRRKRVGLVAVAAALVGGALWIGLRDRGGDSPEAAIYGIAHAVEHRDAEEVCQRLFSNVFLPLALARELKVPGGEPGTPGAWEHERARCAREFGRNGEFESAAFEGPRVERVRMLTITPTQGITRAADARVALGQSARIQTLKLIEYRGSWKLIFVTR